jgi:orotate phosphoribosyltransferase
MESVGARRGHFDLGTGYHGDLWLDLDALFARPSRLRAPVAGLARWLRGRRVDAVCGPMEGGAFLAFALASALEVGFLPAYRGSGVAEYRLAAAGADITGWRVAVVDDAVNAGTAVRACARRLRELGAEVVAVTALLAVGPAADAADRLPLAEGVSVPFHAAEAMRSRAWPAADCPLCADGVPLTE